MARGGTGVGIYSKGAMLWSNADNSLAAFAGNGNSTKMYLHQTQNAEPGWSGIDASSDITTGTLPVARGGTGLSGVSKGDILCGSMTSTSQLASITAAPLGCVLISQGAGNSPIFSAPMTNGQLLIGSTGAAPALATLTPTARQITINNTAGSIVLGTPQNIDSTAQVQFEQLSLGSASLTGTSIYVNKALTSTNATSLYGILSNGTQTVSGNVSADVTGLGLTNEIITNGGTITRASGITVQTKFTNSGTINGAYGLYVKPGSFSGTIPLYAGVFTDTTAVTSTTNAYGGYFNTPSGGATTNIGLYTDGFVCSATGTGKNPTTGQALIDSLNVSGICGIGVENTEANKRSLYVSASKEGFEYTIYSAAYPYFRNYPEVSNFTNLRVYGNFTNLILDIDGNPTSRVNYIGIDTGTSGTNLNIISSFGLYARNPNGSFTDANNIAVYADDISVGDASNKLVNGIYCKLDLKCGRDFYNGSFSSTYKFYSELTKATVWNLDNSTTVVANIAYFRVGTLVTACITNFNMTVNNGQAGFPQFVIAPATAPLPPEYRPQRNLSLPIQMSNNGAPNSSAPGMLYTNKYAWYMYSPTQGQAFSSFGVTYPICPLFQSDTLDSADIVFTYSAGAG